MSVVDMTLVIGLKCKDGVIVGADRLSIKIRATRIKSYISKVMTFNFPDRSILIVGHYSGEKRELRYHYSCVKDDPIVQEKLRTAQKPKLIAPLPIVYGLEAIKEET